MPSTINGMRYRPNPPGTSIWNQTKTLWASLSPQPTASVMAIVPPASVRAPHRLNHRRGVMRPVPSGTKRSRFAGVPERAGA